MKDVQWRVVAGVLLVVVGALLLLQSFDVFAFLWDAVWTVLLAVSGACFLFVYITQPRNWWAVIPGMALLGLGATVGLGIVGLGGLLGGSAFLGALSVAFWLVYLRERQHWWAIIPGGVLATLALVAGIDDVVPWVETEGLFFSGLALTFLLVYLLPGRGEKQSWALIPAGVLFVVGWIVRMATSSHLSFVWPVFLIVVGIILVYRALRAQ